jgi:hypothetical protein
VNQELCNDLKNLKELYLNNNNLDSLPTFLHTKKSLRSKVAHDAEKKSDNDNPTSSTPSSNFNGSFKFTFNLPKLEKIDLSYNKFKSTFTLYSAFALSHNLIEIKLNSNKINFLDVDDQTSDEITSLSRASTNKENIINDEQVKSIRKIPYFKLNRLLRVDLSNNEFVLSKGGFSSLLCDLYQMAPYLTTFIYDQLNGSRLGATDKDNNVNLSSLVNDDYYFDFELLDDNDGRDSSMQNRQKIEAFNNLIERINVIDLSNNDLKKIPTLFYKFKNLK